MIYNDVRRFPDGGEQVALLPSVSLLTVYFWLQILGRSESMRGALLLSSIERHIRRNQLEIINISIVLAMIKGLNIFEILCPLFGVSEFQGLKLHSAGLHITIWVKWFDLNIRKDLELWLFR